MFDNNIKTEPIPERVYELCKMISKGDLKDSVARERMEPKGINPSTSTAYYPIIREVCIKELKLIEKENDVLKYVGDRKVLKGLDTFRIYCNSIVFKDKDTHFYKIVNCFLDSNVDWLQYKTLTDVSIVRSIQDKTGISVTDPMILGSRFWISFLGFGYIQERGKVMYFLPNMHIALQDYCEIAELEKNREYPISEFVETIYEYASVSLQSIKETKKFNVAMSNALRQMHDGKEIILKRNLDSKEKWSLYEDSTHEFIDEITHLIYKGVKRG